MSETSYRIQYLLFLKDGIKIKGDIEPFPHDNIDDKSVEQAIRAQEPKFEEAVEAILSIWPSPNLHGFTPVSQRTYNQLDLISYRAQLGK